MWRLLPLLLVCSCAGEPVVSGKQPQSVLLDGFEDGVHQESAKNVYGRCGPSVIQVMSIGNQLGYFYEAFDNADVMVIKEGASRRFSLKKYIADANGVACVGSPERRRLVFWSGTFGSESDGTINFVVVDPYRFQIEAGDQSPCDARCASKLLRDDLPLKVSPQQTEFKQ